MGGPLRRRNPGAHRHASFAIAALAVVLAGCAARTTGAAALPDRELSGHLLTMERGSWFRPCEMGPDGSLLWVTFTDGSIGQIEAARGEGLALAGDTVFVRWRAAVTDERLVGPGGPALLVRDIAVIRPAEGDDCQSPSGPGR